MQIKEMASKATIQSFLNCYIRETNNVLHMDVSEIDNQDLIRLGCRGVYKISLDKQRLEIIAPLEYISLTDRHIFKLPIYYRPIGTKDLNELDYITMITILCREISLSYKKSVDIDELMLRVILSKKNIELIIKQRIDEIDSVYKPNRNFIESEQSLLLGHLLHPTPKSRQGMTDSEQLIYSPEVKGSFQLDYFRAHSSLIYESSSLAESATSLIKDELTRDTSVSKEFKEVYCGNDDYSLIPMHPLQSQYLLKKQKVQDWINNGLLEYLGPVGSEYSPTSSVRTLYNINSKFMYKFSLNIKITNSLRTNHLKELERGVEVSQLLNTELGDWLTNESPNFHIIQDPAFITLMDEDEEIGFEVMLRENLFTPGQDTNVTLLAGLTQDHVMGKNNYLYNIISGISQRESRSIEEVSIDWFTKYLEISLKPILTLYLKHGIALEAHQQNSLVKLEKGYPSDFYYRDNQGYYYCESMSMYLKKLYPELSKKSHTICSDAIADERIGYYFLFNHLFGLINAFGTSGLINEEILLEQLRATLVSLKPFNRESSKVIDNFMEKKILPCKANLMTRFYDMDELVGKLENQSVYVNVRNPLKYMEGAVDYAIKQ
jgi:spermidine-citrate ligase